LAFDLRQHFVGPLVSVAWPNRLTDGWAWQVAQKAWAEREKIALFIYQNKATKIG